MAHDSRLVKDEGKIEELRSTIPDWIKRLERPTTPCVAPAFGPLEGIRAASAVAPESVSFQPSFFSAIPRFSIHIGSYQLKGT